MKKKTSFEIFFFRSFTSGGQTSWARDLEIYTRLEQCQAHLLYEFDLIWSRNKKDIKPQSYDTQTENDHGPLKPVLRQTG